MMRVKEKIDYYIKHLIKLNNSYIDDMITQNKEVDPNNLLALMFCEEQMQYHEDGTENPMYYVEEEEGDESSEDIPLSVIADMKKSGIDYNFGGETKKKVQKVQKVQKRIVPTYKYIAINFFDMLTGSSLFAQQHLLEGHCNIVLPHDLTMDHKFALYIFFNNRDSRETQETLVRDINERFVYKMLEDLLKYSNDINVLSELIDTRMNASFTSQAIIQHITEKWNEMKDMFHKGRIYGQFALKEMMKQSSEKEYYLPKDVIKMIGQYTKMDGGSKKRYRLHKHKHRNFNRRH